MPLLYPIAGGFEFAVRLNARPASNVIAFEFRSQGLRWHYQPPLANANVDGSTWERGPHGGRSYRPAHMTGAYVGYHATKAWDYSAIGGYNYRAGRAFDIQRSWAEDANGQRVWCEVAIDVARERLAVVVPQAFLDSARYPIVVDPTIGTSTVGGSIDTMPVTKFVAFTSGGASQTDGSGGTLSTLKLACDDATGVDHVRMAVYPNTGTTPPDAGASPASQSVVAGSDTGSILITRTTTPSADADWTAGSVSASLAASTYYWICIGLDNAAEETNLHYDVSSDYSVVRADGVAYASFPPATAPASFSVHDTRIFSAYGSYAAAGSPAPKLMLMGIGT